jgi:hypothetical protein
LDIKTSIIKDFNIFIDNTNSLSLDYNMSTRLFCTFIAPGAVDDTINKINNKYSILFNKIFILESPHSEELICTYNIDTGNVSSQPLPNTILLHRKKESNTLYTINALNILIKSLNGGVLDNQYRVNWYDYKNCILLTTGEELRRLDTKINKVINL